MILEFLWRRFRRGKQSHLQVSPPILDDDADEVLDPDNPFPDVVTVAFQDVIDLHSIPPRQVRAVVEDYIEEAHRRQIRRVRIIHGKGIGVQREMVRSILARSSYILDFQDAPAEAGGWGATVVTLSVDEA
ncbi:MAG: Smr/MutS family protein [Blastocatellia bacterium]